MTVAKVAWKVKLKLMCEAHPKNFLGLGTLSGRCRRTQDTRYPGLGQGAGARSLGYPGVSEDFRRELLARCNKAKNF